MRFLLPVLSKFSQWLFFGMALTVVHSATAAKLVEPIEVSAIVLGENRPEFYFLNQAGEYQRFNVGMNRLGASNYLAPESPALKLFQEKETEEGLSMQETLSIPLPEITRCYLIFNYNAEGGIIYRLIEDSKEIHPGGSLRLVNTTPNEVIFFLNNKTYPVVPGADLNLPISTGEGRFTFSYAMKDAGDFKRMIPTKMLTLNGSDARIMLILTYRKHLLDQGGRTSVTWRPHLTRVYSTVPM